MVEKVSITREGDHKTLNGSPKGRIASNCNWLTDTNDRSYVEKSGGVKCQLERTLTFFTTSFRRCYEPCTNIIISILGGPMMILNIEARRSRAFGL